MARVFALLLNACACGRRANSVEVIAGFSSATPEDLVEVTAGTHTANGQNPSDGNTLPQVKRPWGFNDWVPATHIAGGSWWFRHDDDRFQGMRCTHQPSPWIGDYGHFTLQPALDDSGLDADLKYKAREFRPYLFSATLSNARATVIGAADDIGFEFAPTNRAAALRVTFPSGAPARRLYLRFGQGSVRVKDGALVGYTTENAGGVHTGWKMYFVLKPGPTGNVSVLDKAGVVDFSAGKPGTASIATSFISPTQADSNLQREVGGRSLNAIALEGKLEWQTGLGRVNVTAVDEVQLRVFYTNLWKSMLFPRYLHEINHNNEEEHMSPYTGKIMPGKLVSDSGFWDAYITVYTLQSIAFPDNFGALIDGWVNAFSEAEWLPTWASPGQRGSMVGTMGDATLADAIVKSKWGFVLGFDTAKAYEAIRKDSFAEPSGGFGRDGLADYIRLGYVPESSFEYQVGSGMPESVSRTMNYWVADAAIARAADALGLESDRAELSARSRNYGVLFNNESFFFQPKDDKGEFYKPFDPIAWEDGFTEASAWQYRFYIPHDVEGLTALYQGQLCDRIEEMLTKTKGDAYHPGGYGSTIHEMKEMGLTQPEFGLYGHNNQPSHHILWLAKRAGCNDLADEYLRKVMSQLYTLKGWSGDEDNGEMASWYVLSALGLFSLEMAKDELVVGSPAVVSATVKLPNNRELSVVTTNQGPGSDYVHSVKWTPTGASEPRAVEGNALKYTDVMQGGVLHFTLSPFPSAFVRRSKDILNI